MHKILIKQYRIHFINKQPWKSEILLCYYKAKRTFQPFAQINDFWLETPVSLHANYHQITSNNSTKPSFVHFQGNPKIPHKTVLLYIYMYTHSQLVQICFPKLPYQQTFTEKKRQQIAVRFFSNYTTMTHNRTMTTNPQLRRSLSRFVCQQKQHLCVHSRKKIKPADGEGKKTRIICKQRLISFCVWVVRKKNQHWAGMRISADAKKYACIVEGRREGHSAAYMREVYVCIANSVATECCFLATR